MRCFSVILSVLWRHCSCNMSLAVVIIARAHTRATAAGGPMNGPSMITFRAFDPAQ